MIEARGKCGPECVRAVASVLRSLMRIFSESGGWWLAGFLGTLAVGGVAVWGWDWIRDWWER